MNGMVSTGVGKSRKEFGGGNMIFGEKGTDLLNADENGKVEEKKEEEEKPQKETNSIDYVLMVIILLAIASFGCYYTYYQYNRMEEINSKK